MSENSTAKQKNLIYGPNDRIPFWPLVLSSFQHMFLVISVGLALPVAISAAAGLNVIDSGSLMAAALFGMGITSVFQAVRGKFIGSGYMTFSATDSAAIATCILAAEAGGVPLVLGMSVFSGVLKFILGCFTYKLRKVFPVEATGTLLFIVGLNLVPTSFKYFLGTSQTFNPMHLLVSSLTFLLMISCTLFIKKLKTYSALIGIVFGYILSLITGVLDVSSLEAIRTGSFVSLPVYRHIAFAFDFKMVIPFAVITLASVVDNIGDFSAIQIASEPDRIKPDWKSIERGIRGAGIGCILTAFLGSTMQSTATANNGVARATKIVSRPIAYVASALLMAVAFFPGVTRLLSMIPEPVLGAVIMYSMCYITSSGFDTLRARELDDRKIFPVFLSIAAAVSTLIPGLYSFMPDNLRQILISPVTLGIIVYIVISLISRIGIRKKYTFNTGVSSDEVRALEEDIEKVCKEWGTERILLRKIQIALDSLCESLYELDKDSGLEFNIVYDELQIRIVMNVISSKIIPEEFGEEDIKEGQVLYLTLRILRNMFENVKISSGDKALSIKMESDL